VAGIKCKMRLGMTATAINNNGETMIFWPNTKGEITTAKARMVVKIIFSAGLDLYEAGVCIVSIYQ
jgi:hypothetical protein